MLAHVRVSAGMRLAVAGDLLANVGWFSRLITAAASRPPPRMMLARFRAEKAAIIMAQLRGPSLPGRAGIQLRMSFEGGNDTQSVSALCNDVFTLVWPEPLQRFGISLIGTDVMERHLECGEFL